MIRSSSFCSLHLFILYNCKFVVFPSLYYVFISKTIYLLKWLQIEVHPLLNQKKLIKYCKSLCIEVIAYSPFASPARPWAKPDDPKLDFKDPRLVKIAKHHKKTTAQVILRHIIQNGAVPVPKSVKKERLIENADVFNFCLTPKEMNILDCFDCNGRVVPASELKGFPNYPFNIEYWRNYCFCYSYWMYLWTLINYCKNCKQ